MSETDWTAEPHYPSSLTTSPFTLSGYFGFWDNGMDDGQRGPHESPSGAEIKGGPLIHCLDSNI